MHIELLHMQSRLFVCSAENTKDKNKKFLNYKILEEKSILQP